MDVLAQPVIGTRTLLLRDSTELACRELQPIDVRADVVTAIVVDRAPGVSCGRACPCDELVGDVRAAWICLAVPNCSILYRRRWESEMVKIQTVKVTDARQQFSQLLNSVYRERRRVMIEKSGIPVAALISARDLERLDQLEEQRQRDFSVLDEIGDAFKNVPDDELDREVTNALAQVRREKSRTRTTQARARKSPGRSRGR